MTESLGVYWGGFLNSPIPLEFSLNWCSHACHYCYANLNSPNRTTDMGQIMGLLSNYNDRTTYAAQLLKMGYPVLCSTHVDFFAKSNVQQSIPLMELMNELDIKFAISTRGGDHYIEVIKKLPPKAIYFSVTTLDDDISIRVEPGAPLPSERLKMIEQSVEFGHRVVVGINPTVPEWISDPIALMQSLKDVGVEGILSQPLHLNNRQIANISDRGLAALGESVLSRGKKRNRDKETTDLVNQIQSIATDMGLSIRDLGQSRRSDCWRPFKDIYPVLMPTLQDFVNYCWDSGKTEGDIIEFEEFRDFFLPELPQGIFPLRNHLNATQNRKWCAEWNEVIPKNMTYESLLYWVWKLNDIAYCPVNAMTFRWAGELDTDGEWIKYTDSNEMPFMIFTPSATKNEVMTAVELVTIESGSEASIC